MPVGSKELLQEGLEGSKEVLQEGFEGSKELLQEGFKGSKEVLQEGLEGCLTVLRINETLCPSCTPSCGVPEFCQVQPRDPCAQRSSLALQDPRERAKAMVG